MTTIRTLPAKDFHVGTCSCCKREAILKWSDSEAGRLGDCCVKEMLIADEVLRMAYKYQGVIRPQGVKAA